MDTATTPDVGYRYADGSINTVRPDAIIYPDGQVVELHYGPDGEIDDAASRVKAIVDAGHSGASSSSSSPTETILAEYEYLGLGTVVEVNYTEPEIKYTLVGTAGGNDPDTGDIYRGLDRFGRIKDAYGYNYGTSTDAARIKYGYDRASNRTYREDVVATSMDKDFDELYQYDGLYRLKHMQRGRLNKDKTAVTDETFTQCWTLDATGNWRRFQQDDDGSGLWDLKQERSTNRVNEITAITETAGPAWATPAYDKAGNMTTIPCPDDPEKSFTGTYDAWNRQTSLVDDDTATTVQEAEYNGLKFRTVVRGFSKKGELSETRHFYYTISWQCVEERLEPLASSSSTIDPAALVDQQYIWGIRYIDDLICRIRAMPRSSSGSGLSTLDSRLYALQDANWNTIAIADPTGAIVERYAYSPYGSPIFLTPGFVARTASLFGWNILFSGYTLDSTGLYSVRFRLLHSLFGWLQRDPIENEVSEVNLYQYVGSTPLINADPTGQAWSGGFVGSLEIRYNVCTGDLSLTGWIWVGFGYEAWGKWWGGVFGYVEGDLLKTNVGALLVCGKCKDCCSNDDASHFGAGIAGFRENISTKIGGVTMGVLFTPHSRCDG